MGITPQPDSATNLPTEAELAPIHRGALVVLIGFVLSVVARIIFHGAQLTLDAGALSGASGMRPPEAPDPDFMLLLPLLAVVLVAKLIEAFGKIVCLSRTASSVAAGTNPPRLNYLPLHLSLACDLVAVAGIMLRVVNFGRTAGPMVPWMHGFDLVGLAAMLPFGRFARSLALAFRVPSIAFWARFNMVAATVLIVAGARPEWWLMFMAFWHQQWRGALAVLFVVALAAVGSYVAMLSKILGLKLAEPPAGGST